MPQNPSLHCSSIDSIRSAFRHFRTDRVVAVDFLDERYPDRPGALRAKWRKELSRPKVKATA